MNPRDTVENVAGALAEAATLLAVAAVPLYFTTLAQNGYEAEKSILVRVLALVAAGSWVLSGRIISTRLGFRRWDPLVLLASAVFLAYCLATALSIDPRVSMWGSFGRQEGLWTHAAYLVFFLVVALHMRSTTHRYRLITVLLYASVPVVAYALAQQVGYDPVPSTGDPNTLHWPVRATMGQHVFLGSYLVMLLPFTAVEAWCAWMTPGEPGESANSRHQVEAVLALCGVVGSFFILLVVGNGHPALYALFPALIALYCLAGLQWWTYLVSGSLGPVAKWTYTGLAVAQVVALGATGARGAWLGAFAAGASLAFLAAWRARRADVWPFILGACIVAGAFLLVLNIPGGPLEPLRTVKGLNRLANITDSGGAGGSGQGRILIWQGVLTLMTHLPSVGHRWGGVGRLLVGYGPESLHWAFQAVFPLKLRVVTSEIWTWDRAHNVFLDYLVDAGLLGFLAMIAVMLSFFRRVIVGAQELDRMQALFLIAGGSALVGHAVDGFFGLETAVTLLLLWVAVGLGVNPSSEGADEPSISPARPPLTPVVSFAAVLALGALILGTWSGVTEQPALLSLVWLCATVGGAGVVALWLCPEPVGTGFTLPGVSRGVLAVCAASTLALGSQFRTEAANYAERAGLTYLATGNNERATSFLQEATLYNGFEPQFDTELGEGYLALFSLRANASGPVITASSATARTLGVSVREQLGQGQLLQLSLASLRQAQDLAPLDPDAADNLGNVDLVANDYPGAMAQYALAQHLSKDNPRYQAETAKALLQAGRTREAAVWAQRALQLDTTFWYAHYMLALVDNRRGAKTQARSEAQLALIWMRNYYPQPPATQVSQLRQLLQSG